MLPFGNFQIQNTHIQCPSRVVTYELINGRVTYENLGRWKMPNISVFLNIPSLLGLTPAVAEQCTVLIYCVAERTIFVMINLIYIK